MKTFSKPLVPVESKSLLETQLPFEDCPQCGLGPFTAFDRGSVQRRRYRWFFFGRWDYCAIICWNCKKIVGWETPPRLTWDEWLKRRGLPPPSV